MSEGSNMAVEIVGASVANKTTVAGAGVGAVGFLTSDVWFGLIGVLIAVLGLTLNIYFQLRRDRRETAESLARIKAIQERGNHE